MSLSKEDYTEPQCPLCMNPEIKPIPVGRIIEKLDSLLEKNDYYGAERHLQYWLSEAEVCNDMHGKLTVLNEMIGLFRKTNKETDCLKAVDDALTLAKTMGAEQTVSFGTTLINAATGYKAFGKAESALPLYRRAREIYETNLDPEDGKLGGLYNNMALTLSELEAYDEAEDLYNKAIRIMEKQENGALEIAITNLNLADLIAAKSGLDDGAEQIERYLTDAEKLLNLESLPKDGYYAYVCEKCAPAFGYYGYFAAERELHERARMIYERS